MPEPHDDIESLRRDWSSLKASAGSLVDVNAVERVELQEAMHRIDARFERFESESLVFREEVRRDIGQLKSDMANVKGMAKLMTVVVSVGVPAIIAAIGWFVK